MTRTSILSESRSLEAAAHGQGEEVAMVHRLRLSLLAFALLVPSLACTADQGPPGGATGKASSAVDDGLADPSAYSYVVKLNWPDGTQCSGVLVTPTMVLTANHCLTDTTPAAGGPGCLGAVNLYSGYPWERNQPVTVSFFNGSLTVAADRIRHTPTGLAPVRMDRRVDSCSEGDSARDIGLVTLDSKANPLIAMPKHPAAIAGEPYCGISIEPGRGDFYGTLIGFASGQRVFASSFDWHYDVTAPGELVRRRIWDLTSETYNGIERGDSGGAFLRDADISSGTLCGTISRYFYQVIIAKGNDTAALDSPNNHSWLTSYLVDAKKGGLVGECPPGTPAVDSDGDGWYDDCDNCRYIVNSHQEDTDGDGVGDFCDNCINNKNPAQTNHNLLAEIDAFGLPPCGVADPRPPISGEPTEACSHVEPPAAVYQTTFYPGDVCDQHPLSAPAPTLTGYHDDGGRSISCTLIPGKYCPPSSPTPSTCAIELGNVFHTSEFVGGGAGYQLGLTRAMACKCPSTIDLVSCQTLPAYNCSRFDVVGGGSASWNAMSLAPVTPPSEFSTLNLAPGMLSSQHPDLLTSAAYQQDWGWRYWFDVPFLPPPAPGGMTAFDGLTWTWVRSFNPPSGGAPVVGASVTGAGSDITRRQFVKRALVTENGSTSVTHDCTETRYTGFNPFPGLGGDPFWVIGLEGPVGPPMPGDPPPDVVVTSPSFGATPVTSVLPSDVLAAIRGTSNLQIITASDTPENWTGTRSGVLFDPTSGGIVSILGMSGGVPFSEPILQDPKPPFVAAVSGHRQELALFGLRDSSGKMLDVITRYDFDLRVATAQPILSELKLVDPVAVTYRAEDDSYYLLDRAVDDHAHPVMRLVRATLGGTVEQLHEWTRASDFTDFAITTGNDGAIVLSAWSKARHAIAEVGFSSDFLPYVRRVTTDRDPLVLPALARFEGVYLVRLHGSRQILERLPNADIPKDKRKLDADLDALHPAFF